MLILGAGYHKPHLGGWLPCKLILGAGYGSLDYGGRGLATGDGKFECTVISGLWGLAMVMLILGTGYRGAIFLWACYGIWGLTTVLFIFGDGWLRSSGSWGLATAWLILGAG